MAGCSRYLTGSIQGSAGIWDLGSKTEKEILDVRTSYVSVMHVLVCTVHTEIKTGGLFL